MADTNTQRRRRIIATDATQLPVLEAMGKTNPTLTAQAEARDACDAMLAMEVLKFQLTDRRLDAVRRWGETSVRKMAKLLGVSHGVADELIVAVTPTLQASRKKWKATKRTERKAETAWAERPVAERRKALEKLAAVVAEQIAALPADEEAAA